MLVLVPGGFLASQIFGASYLRSDLSTQRVLERIAQTLGEMPAYRHKEPAVLRDVLWRCTSILMRATQGIPRQTEVRTSHVSQSEAIAEPSPTRGWPPRMPTRLPLVAWRERNLQPLLADWNAQVAGLQRLMDLQPPGDLRAPEVLSAAYFYEVARAAMRLAYHDELTGLRNRHELERLIPILEARLSRKRRNSPSSFFLMVDIDHFKRVNDDHGHDAGDLVLQEVAKSLFKVREGDFVFRVGGEEFLLYLGGVGERGIRRVAQRIRREVSELRIFVPDLEEPLRVTVSVGVGRFRSSTPRDAARPDHPGTPAARAIKEADLALYRAKERGRNRVAYYWKG